MLVAFNIKCSHNSLEPTGLPYVRFISQILVQSITKQVNLHKFNASIPYIKTDYGLSSEASKSTPGVQIIAL